MRRNKINITMKKGKRKSKSMNFKKGKSSVQNIKEEKNIKLEKY